MRTRLAIGIAVWALLLVGVGRLFGDAAVPAAIGTVVLAGSLLLASRLRPHRTPIQLPLVDTRDLPVGPRRVLLVETGLVGPE